MSSNTQRCLNFSQILSYQLRKLPVGGVKNTLFGFVSPLLGKHYGQTFNITEGAGLPIWYFHINQLTKMWAILCNVPRLLKKDNGKIVVCLVYILSENKADWRNKSGFDKFPLSMWAIVSSVQLLVIGAVCHPQKKPVCRKASCSQIPWELRTRA